MTQMTTQDHNELTAAAAKLEGKSFAMTVAAKVGMPVEALLRMLPARAQGTVSAAVNKSLEQCLKLALSFNKDASGSPASQHRPYRRHGGHGRHRRLLRFGRPRPSSCP